MKSDLPDYSVFIITYRRPDVLGGTIQTLVDQSHPPEVILVMDNDPEQSAQQVISSYADSPVTLEYVPMGYNAGPAGAARKGLELLSQRPYPWIQWIDDDDPPRNSKVNQRLFELIPDEWMDRAGILTPSGNDFSLRWGKSQRYTNSQLEENEWLHPKTVGGGQGMMISKEVVKQGCLPLEDLFFGFEELDFCLRVRQAGFDIIAPTELFKLYRKSAGRWSLTRKERRIQSYETPAWRQYYSVRNLVYILHYRQSRGFAAVFVSLRNLVKSVLYDLVSLKITRTHWTLLAIRDAYRKRLGARYKLIELE